MHPRCSRGDGRRAGGRLLEEGFSGAYGRGGPEPRAELEPARGARQEAEVRLSPGKAAGHQAPEARSGLWAT